MMRRAFAAGEIIFREGEESTDAFCILTGRVGIRIRTPQGPCLLMQLGPGEIFGEMGMIDDAPRSATAEAIEATEVEVIGEVDFSEAVLRRPERLQRYLAAVFERLRHATTLLRMQAPAGDASLTPVATPPHRLRLCSRYAESGFAATAVDMLLERLPFLIGRQTPGGGPFAVNDLCLPDRMPYQVSRNHCAIEQRGTAFFVRDRGSGLGTVVNGVRIGVRCAEIEAELRVGVNELILGHQGSPHRFTLVVEPV